MSKLEIDKNIIDETTHCRHSFACLDGDFSQCGGVERKGDVLLCPTAHTPEFCFYRVPFLPTGILCQCYVRKEIFKKYDI